MSSNSQVKQILKVKKKKILKEIQEKHIKNYKLHEGK